MIAAIVLAAGESRRMGRNNKMTMRFGLDLVIQRVVKVLEQSNVDHIIVVGGHAADTLRKVLCGFPITFVENSQYRTGMFSSVQAGLLVLPPAVTAFLVVLGDQPQLGAELINHVVETYASCGKPILIPTHDGVGGHPIVISTAFREELLHQRDKEGLRGFLSNHREEICRHPVPFSEILRDIDTPEDYAKELGRIERNPLEKGGLRIMRAIRAVLLRDWDPLCLQGCPDDEYDAYIGRVYRKLLERPSPDFLAEFLLQIESRELGVCDRTVAQVIPAALELLKLDVEIATIP